MTPLSTILQHDPAAQLITESDGWYIVRTKSGDSDFCVTPVVAMIDAAKRINIKTMFCGWNVRIVESRQLEDVCTIRGRHNFSKVRVGLPEPKCLDCGLSLTEFKQQAKAVTI